MNKAPFQAKHAIAFEWPFVLTAGEIAAWISVSDRMHHHLASNKSGLIAENERLREALYGEYCDCGEKEATIIPSTHDSSCKYRMIMQRILSLVEEDR